MYEDDEEGEVWSGPIAVAELPANALAYLQSIYRNPSEPDGRRMRAAMAALPFETPKLAVTTNISNENFAAMLDRAIAASGKTQVVRQRALAPWCGSGIEASDGVHIPTQTESAPDGKDS